VKQKLLTLPGLLLVLVAGANPVRAEVTLFEESFENGNLNQWTGKFGLSHHGQIVTDPLNPTNHALTFTLVNAAGDIFSASPISLAGLPGRFILSFDFLGLPVGGVAPSEYGGFAGIASGSGVTYFWLAGTYLPALTVPFPVATTLAADGQWHHYEVDFTDIATANNLTSLQLMLEDWYDRGSIPGDVYFDNVRLRGTLSPAVALIWPAVEVGWVSATNRLYQVQWTSQLNPNAWIDLGPPVRGNGSTNSVLDSTRDQPKKFYRVLTVE